MMMEPIDTVDAAVPSKGSVFCTVGQFELPSVKDELIDSDSFIFLRKKQELEERLSKREEARAAKLAKMKEDKLQKTAANEKSDYFSSTFSELRSNIEKKIKEAASVNKDALIDYFDSLTKEYQSLEKFVSDSTFFLSSYDVRVAQENLKTILSEIHSKQDELLPKKKFAFRSRRKEVVNKDVVDARPKADLNAKSPSDLDNQVFDFVGLKGQTIIKHSDEMDGKNLGIAQVEDCCIYLYGVPNTLHLRGLRNCKVFTGPVATSVFVFDCTSCTFVTACQQLRVHTTKESTFYLHVASRAIIEDSTSLKFAPYNWHYDGIDAHFSEAGFDKDDIRWTAVDDFNWLARDVPSPNWSEIPEEDRVSSWG